MALAPLTMFRWRVVILNGSSYDSCSIKATAAKTNQQAVSKLNRMAKDLSESETTAPTKPGLFYGTGIPACVLVINKNDSAKRKSVLFINADREYKEGKNQNSLRPEDIEKITHVYRNRLSVPKYSREVPIAELEKEEFNLNIRRYVDNSPPP